jgi:hypothetical protein
MFESCRDRQFFQPFANGARLPFFLQIVAIGDGADRAAWIGGNGARQRPLRSRKHKHLGLETGPGPLARVGSGVAV